MDGRQPLVDPVNGELLTAIAWQDADALPFPLCLSSVTDAAHESLTLGAVSVAHGNVLASDQGVWTTNEFLGKVLPAPPAPVAGTGCDCNQGGAAVSRPRYAPVLASQPLTFAVPFDHTAPASSFLAPNVSLAQPQILLTADDGLPWDAGCGSSGAGRQVPPALCARSKRTRRRTCALAMAPMAPRPEPKMSFNATYRTGSGAQGNVGREALRPLAACPGWAVSGVRNPIAAAGGMDPETMEHIRQVAPFQFESQLRCVTEDDYGAQAAAVAGVREAKGTMRWTGSWYTAFTSIDPATAPLIHKVKTLLNTRRMMGRGPGG